MERLFIEAESDVDVLEVAKKVKFEGKLGIVTTVQHFHKIKDVQKLFSNAVIAGKVLGCNASAAAKVKDEVDAFLYIGSGNFHPIQIALETGKKVLTADPIGGKVGEITEEQVEKRKRRIKAAYTKFLAAEKIGVLVSTKEGQANMAAAEQLEKKYRDKEFFMFVFDTLDFSELENFTDIECWVNTSCPRMAVEDYEKFQKPTINIAELGKAFKSLY